MFIKISSCFKICLLSIFFPNLSSNLNEISYLSTKCDLIIGRSSGPYTFCIVEENYNKNKLICLCDEYSSSWFMDNEDYDIKSSTIENKDFTWSNNYNVENILELIKNKLG